jgi:hypothetical protein
MSFFHTGIAVLLGTIVEVGRHTSKGKPPRDLVL